MNAAPRLPAFGKAILKKRQQGLAPANSLVVCLDWDMGKGYHPWRVVVPPDTDLATVDFGLCAGLDVMIRGTDQSRMDAVARKLLELPLARLVGITDHITIYWPGPT